MNICTHQFILIYVPIMLIAYYLSYRMKGMRTGKFVLVLASIIFYVVASFQAFTLLLVESIITYLLAKKANKNKNKSSLAIAICLQITILLIFKYYNFFITTINPIFHAEISTLNLIVPLGISFFTFQQIAFTVDMYRNEIKEANVVDYFIFSFLFVTISSGPILYYNELTPQLNKEETYKVNYENLYKGLILFFIGICKKILVANVFATAVIAGYEDLYSYGAFNALVISLCYTFQIYFDFSGYCDVGLGIAKMMNINLPLNFDSPYKSFTIAEFWDRWHITLTRFFTKYVYIPLGGSRKGKRRTYANVFIIFLLSGLWHGADTKYVIWGAMHGIMMIVYRMFRRYIDKWHPAFNWIITFSFVNVAWAYFGAPTKELANTLISKIISLSPGTVNPAVAEAFIGKIFSCITNTAGIDMTVSHPYVVMIMYLAISFFVVLCCRNSYEYVNENEISVSEALIITVIAILAVCSLTGTISFVYQYF